MEVEQVTCAGSGEHNEQEDDEEPIQTFRTETETEHCLQSPEPDEGEVLDVVLNQQLQQDEPEGVCSEPLTNSVIK